MAYVDLRVPSRPADGTSAFLTIAFQNWRLRWAAV